MIAYFTQIHDEVAADAKSIYSWQLIEIVNEFELLNFDYTLLNFDYT